MKIEDIDKNFASSSAIPEGTEFFDVTQKPFSVHGVFTENGAFTRMPLKEAEKINDGVRSLCHCTAGGRVRFSSDTDYMVILAHLSEPIPMPHAPYILSAGFDIYRDGHYFQTVRPPLDFSLKRYTYFAESDGKSHEYTVVMPCYGGVESLFIGLSAGCNLMPSSPYKISTPFIYYGSSITQGGCASRPGMTYQEILSRTFDADYFNFGFSGSAKGEEEMADFINSIIKKYGCEIFIYDYDHNAPSAEHLEKTHALFFKKIRNENPLLPIIMLSMPSPSTSASRDNYLRRDIIERTYKAAVSEGDENVCFIGGEEFAPDGECTVDGIHLSDLGFYNMAKRIEKEIKKILK